LAATEYANRPAGPPDPKPALRQPGRSGFGTAAAQAIKGQFRRYPFSVGEPEDIARIALFLASDQARMITGAIIPADGGLSAYK
jgi:NAD(P)-dependent dehydrogenase (short-subunit alcohol dehydrogenase family)